MSVLVFAELGYLKQSGADSNTFSWRVFTFLLESTKRGACWCSEYIKGMVAVEVDRPADILVLERYMARIHRRNSGQIAKLPGEMEAVQSEHLPTDDLFF